MYSLAEDDGREMLLEYFIGLVSSRFGVSCLRGGTPMGLALWPGDPIASRSGITNVL
jgi:hypothetical protein